MQEQCYMLVTFSENFKKELSRFVNYHSTLIFCIFNANLITLFWLSLTEFNLFSLCDSFTNFHNEI